MRKVNLPEDIESADDTFFSHTLVDDLIKIANTKSKIDWNNLFGTTVEARFEDIVCKLSEITNEIVKKGGKGYFWLVGSPEMVSIFESVKYFVSAPEEQMPLGYNYVMFIGVLHKKWRIYSDPLIGKNRMLIGAGFRKKPAAFYGILDIENFK